MEQPKKQRGGYRVNGGRKLTEQGEKKRVTIRLYQIQIDKLKKHGKMQTVIDVLIEKLN